MKVLLDTNMLLVPHQFGVDIFEFMKDYRIITLSACVDELNALSKKRGDDGKAARVALGILKEKKIEVVKTKEKGDAAIKNFAVIEKCSVATNDAALIKALKKHGIRVIRLRQNKYLVEE
jgi:rRNA-processing protein FCF1